MLVAGDGKNFPMIGDIVRVRYVCTIVEGPQKGKIITSTKNGMKLLSVEFVLGVGQVIKGFDRALPQMSIGERSKITITSEYAYGKAGYFPHIPPDAEIEFDITLLGFRPRPAWVKPLIQELGYVMKPFEVTGKEQAEGVQLPDDDDSLTSKNFKGDGGAAGGGGGGGKKKSSDAGRKKISNAQKV
jgi:FK506-binding protein 1